MEAPGVAMVTDWGVFTVLLPPGGSVATTPGMQISFFTFDPRQALDAEGVVYPVRGLRLRRWHDAALNEAAGDAVSLSFVGEHVVVYRAFIRGSGLRG